MRQEFNAGDNRRPMRRPGPDAAPPRAFLIGVSAASVRFHLGAALSEAYAVHAAGSLGPPD